MDKNKKGYEKLTELLTDGKYLFFSANGEPCYVPTDLAEDLLRFFHSRVEDSVNLKLHIAYLRRKLEVLMASDRLEEAKTELAEVEIQVIEEEEAKEAKIKKIKEEGL